MNFEHASMKCETVNLGNEEHGVDAVLKELGVSRHRSMRIRVDLHSSLFKSGVVSISSALDWADAVLGSRHDWSESTWEQSYAPLTNWHRFDVETSLALGSKLLDATLAATEFGKSVFIVESTKWAVNETYEPYVVHQSHKEINKLTVFKMAEHILATERRAVTGMLIRDSGALFVNFSSSRLTGNQRMAPTQGLAHRLYTARRLLLTHVVRSQLVRFGNEPRQSTTREDRKEERAPTPGNNVEVLLTTTTDVTYQEACLSAGLLGEWTELKHIPRRDLNSSSAKQFAVKYKSPTSVILSRNTTMTVGTGSIAFSTTFSSDEEQRRLLSHVDYQGPNTAHKVRVAVQLLASDVFIKSLQQKWSQERRVENATPAQDRKRPEEPTDIREKAKRARTESDFVAIEVDQE